MRILAGLAVTLGVIASQASAATFYVVGQCGTGFNYGFTTTPPNSGSGTLACPSAASLGITGTLTVASEFLVYESDYSSGLSPTVTTVTNWAFSGATLQFSADTTTVTGTSSSQSNVSTDGLTFNPLTTSFGPIVLAGYYDTISGFGTPTVSYTTQATVGSALQGTGYAEVVYDYNVTTGGGTPEPVSMLLFGSGLVAVAVFGRKKFARR